MNISHVLNLDGIGGVERDFTSFIASPHAHKNGLAHKLTSGTIHQELKPLLENNLTQISNYKQIGPLPVPKIGSLRSISLAASLVRQNPSLVVFWNHMDRPSLLNVLHNKSIRTFYYEHGSAWRQNLKNHYKAFLSQVDFLLANSQAAKRMLELRWDVSRPVEVLPNALRPDIAPVHPQQKRLPQGRAFRIGIAARLVSHKGIFVALHTLYALDKQGFQAELYIAGRGPEKEAFLREARRLGLEKKIVFKGFVSDMSTFYQEIDLFLLPSVREPFGLVSIEAQAWGCPVVLSRIDGLPETLTEGETGRTVTPTLPLSEYLQMGGSNKKMPSLVYSPEADTVGAPKLTDPALLAKQIISIGSLAKNYEQMSLNASVQTLKRFDYTQHIVALLEFFGKTKPL